MVIFKPDGHSYSSTDEDIKWTSVTSLVSQFKTPFNAQERAQKSSKNKKSKWYGMPTNAILEAWNTESRRSTDLGTWYHDQREKDLTSLQTLELNGVELPIIRPIYEDGVKVAPDQALSEGIYPEHFVYLKSAGLCGQADLVEISNGLIHIVDYKTNKEIRSAGYRSWDGKVQKMAKPVSHLDDCNLQHYTLQLSLYMYMMLRHNPRLKPGSLVLNHISFEIEGKDQFDNPIYKKDIQGNFIVSSVNRYTLKYLKNECRTILEWLEKNRDKVKTH